MRWMGAGVACVMMASLVVGAQAADTTHRLEAALQRQESQRLVGALRLENCRRRAARRQHLLRGERRHSCLSHAGGRQRAAERVHRDRRRLSGLRAQPRIQMGREEIRAAPRTWCATPGSSITCIASAPADWPAGSEAQIQEGDTGDSWAVSSQAVQLRRSEDRPLCAAGKWRRADHGGQRRQVRAHAPQQASTNIRAGTRSRSSCAATAPRTSSMAWPTCASTTSKAGTRLRIPG